MTHIINDLWEAVGNLKEDDAIHLLTRLFTLYEKRLECHPQDEAATDFFRSLSQALTLVNECNLNRR